MGSPPCFPPFSLFKGEGERMKFHGGSMIDGQNL